jgi:hypothetical protein
MPFVLCTPCSRTGVVTSDNTTIVYLPKPGGGDPAVYEDEVIAGVKVGDDIVFHDSCNSRLEDVKMYHGAYSEIQDGWVLCDDADLPADKKVAAAKAPNMKGRFALAIDRDNDAGDGSENAIGDTGGERWHGESGNNHANHDNHEHRLKMSSFDPYTVDDNDDGLTFTVWDPNAVGSTPETSGVKEVDGSSDVDLLNHYGLIDNSGNRDTDNRSKFYVLAFIYRYK